MLHKFPTSLVSVAGGYRARKVHYSLTVPRDPPSFYLLSLPQYPLVPPFSGLPTLKFGPKFYLPSRVLPTVESFAIPLRVLKTIESSTYRWEFYSLDMCDKPGVIPAPRYPFFVDDKIPNNTLNVILYGVVSKWSLRILSENTRFILIFDFARWDIKLLIMLHNINRNRRIYNPIY